MTMMSHLSTFLAISQIYLLAGERKLLSMKVVSTYLPTGPSLRPGHGSAWTGGISDKSEFMQIEMKRNFDPFM